MLTNNLIKNACCGLTQARKISRGGAPISHGMPLPRAREPKEVVGVDADVRMKSLLAADLLKGKSSAAGVSRGKQRDKTADGVPASKVHA